MMENLPKSILPIRPFLSLADEIESSDHHFADVLAFVTRKYAALKAFKSVDIASLPDSDVVEEYLASFLDKLEGDKQYLESKYGSEADGDGKGIIQWGGKLTKRRQLEIAGDHALHLYVRGENAYRQAMADKDTVKSFYMAAHLFEVAHEINVDFLLLKTRSQLRVSNNIFCTKLTHSSVDLVSRNNGCVSRRTATVANGWNFR